MLVYRKQQQTVALAPRLKQLAAALAPGAASHDAVTEWLIEAGMLEAGVADALCPRHDEPLPMLEQFRALSTQLGEAFVHSWHGRPESVRAALDQAQIVCAALQPLPLPHTVCLSVPEGYAHYGLYLETYLAAAAGFAQEQRPARAVCLGLRSIGTSLSAVVAATLSEAGVSVESYTLRPRGHPFQRAIQLAPALCEAWRAGAPAWFLIVDEGPGLSGSSLTCVAERLVELGIAEERIVFFPSHAPDGSQFCSAAARTRWHRHRKYLVSFEELTPVETLRTGIWRDLSGGQWRRWLYADAAAYPAVQPQHERRKFLCPRTGLWLKFAGLGRFGRAKWERAQRLAEAGFTPPPRELAQGCLHSTFVAGQPVSPATVTQALLRFSARYLAFLRREFPATPSLSSIELSEMVRVNLTEAFGVEWAESLEQCQPPAWESVCALDGRVLAHEWLRTQAGYVKTDALDHHDDHFYPGCTDIAWDVAGVITELALDASQRAYLLAVYQQHSGDRTLTQRLPFFTLAYLAFRLGYTRLAAETLGAGDEAKRFQMLARGYAAQLQRGWPAWVRR